MTDIVTSAIKKYSSFRIISLFAFKDSANRVKKQKTLFDFSEMPPIFGVRSIPEKCKSSENAKKRFLFFEMVSIFPLGY